MSSFAQSLRARARAYESGLVELLAFSYVTGRRDEPSFEDLVAFQDFLRALEPTDVHNFEEVKKSQFRALLRIALEEFKELASDCILLQPPRDDTEEDD